MADRLDELAVFVAILEAGSLAGAARRLRRSPPSITRSLAALESRAGARLMERNTRRLISTPAGQLLGEHARLALAAYDSALLQAADDAPRGVLRLTAPLVFGRRHVMALVTAFLELHPGLRAELVLSDRYLDLIEDGLDIAVRIGRLAPSGLVARRLGEVRRLLVGAPAYLAGYPAPDAPAALASHMIVATEAPGTPLEWRFQRDGQDATIRLTPRLAANDVDAALLAVRAGQGLGRFLSYQVVDDLAQGTLVRLLPEWEPPPLPVQLVVPSARQMPSRVRAFLNYAVSRSAALPI